MGQKLMTFVERMEAPGPNTFRILLREPCGFVLEALGKPSSNVPFIMPKRVADTPADKQIEDAIGSGPYVFKKDEFKPGDKAVYVKKRPVRAAQGDPFGHRRRQARLRRPRGMEPGAARCAVAGQCARQRRGRRHRAARVRELRAAEGRSRTSRWSRKDPLGFQYMCRFNHLHPPFNNPKVRQAALAAMPQEPFLRAQVGVQGVSTSPARRCSPAARLTAAPRAARSSRSRT